MTKIIHSFKYSHSTNLGDEVQTLAALNLIKKLGLKFGGVVERDNPQSTSPINLLINGFIWPSALTSILNSPNVNPIFSNFHLADSCGAQDLMKNAAALNKLAPIGGRDRWTTQQLKKAKIDAFFNYCLTLTFARRKSEPIKGKIFVVGLDAFVPIPKELNRQGLHYITHESVNVYSHDTKMRMAQELLDLYKEKAKLVITSKLHCALPCVAMGIPVLLFGNHEAYRLKLAEEVIPIHPYVVLDDVYTALKILPYPNSYKIKYFVKKTAKKIRWHMKYQHHLKHKIDWDPQPPDIEELKEKIIKATGEQIQRLT